jgi:hypothetical protein
MVAKSRIKALETNNLAFYGAVNFDNKDVVRKGAI